MNARHGRGAALRPSTPFGMLSCGSIGALSYLETTSEKCVHPVKYFVKDHFGAPNLSGDTLAHGMLRRRRRFGARTAPVVGVEKNQECASEYTENTDLSELRQSLDVRSRPP